MRRWIVRLVLLLAPFAAHGDDDIVGVLARSQLARLRAVAPADATSERADKVRVSFDALIRTLGIEHPPELRLVEGDTVAESLQGRFVLANVSLARLDEGERLFILAHELGHVQLRHWEQTERLYRRWVPGAVTPEQTDPIAGPLGRDASNLAHRQELEADAFALRALHRLGRPLQDAVAAFMRFGVTLDTASHPGTTKRLASLRAAEAGESEGEREGEPVGDGRPDDQAPTRNELIDSFRRPD